MKINVLYNKNRIKYIITNLISKKNTKYFSLFTIYPYLHINIQRKHKTINHEYRKC